MIREDDLFCIGKIARLHGLGGEVEMPFTSDVFDRCDCDYFFLRIDGLFVPFFWEEYRFKNTSTAYVRFEDIDSVEAARPLIGCKVYLPYSALPADENEADVALLEGFRLLNDDGSEVGTIEGVDDSSENVLLSVRAADGRELLIPLHDDLVADFDVPSRTLRMRLPEGLLDL